MNKMFSNHVIVAALALCVVAVRAEKIAPIQAIAYLDDPAGVSQVKGNITFTQNACGENVYIRIYVTGLTPGKHGFHVHEKGDLTNGCLSTGGHYNPEKVDHAAPNDEVRHVGDLGNIEANEYGVVDTMLTDHVISLSGKRAVIGRGIVIHSDADDLGKTNHPDSKKTGNAGSRVACGIIVQIWMNGHVEMEEPMPLDYQYHYFQ
ncbi:extracellular superoxide dismutase [Cu-Zn] isoform X3 [Teleopsis dalmanni]|uniref:extracellular superoxide dismutase [Cu-Zn] isoform X3 n=1 Tax=Teleopsis dalmanni TaxID=139649 RepID=UPI0018CDABCF|nr:extracellular superoxide dismutase [Cu-Zn] isoform X3 [Teleopsis dalmanni]